MVADATISGAPLHPYNLLPLRPASLLPIPQRVGRKLNTPALRTYTVQSRAAYEVLLRDGVLRSTPGAFQCEYADNPGIHQMFSESYSWMDRQMTKRGLEASDGSIVWLWARTSRRDLRDSARSSTTGDVLLVVDVPREEALLSHFDDWHAVLNRCKYFPELPGETTDEYFERTGTADDEFRRRCEPWYNKPISQWPADLRNEMETSWESIFETVGAARFVQACVREVRSEQVVDAMRIVTRPRGRRQLRSMPV